MLPYRADNFGVTTKESPLENTAFTQPSISQVKYKRHFYSIWKEERVTLDNFIVDIPLCWHVGFCDRSFTVQISFCTVIWCTLNWSGIWLHGGRIHVFACLWFAVLCGLSVQKMGVKHDPSEALLQCVLVLWPAFVFYVKKPNWSPHAEAHGHFLTLVTAKANSNQNFLQPQPLWVLPMMGHGHYHSRSHNPSAPAPYLQKWPTPAAEEEANHTAVDVYVVIWPGREFHPFCWIDLGPAAWCFMSPPKLLGISVCLFNSNICNYGCSIYLCECHSLFS